MIELQGQGSQNLSNYKSSLQHESSSKPYAMRDNYMSFQGVQSAPPKRDIEKLLSNKSQRLKKSIEMTSHRRFDLTNKSQLPSTPNCVLNNSNSTAKTSELSQQDKKNLRMKQAQLVERLSQPRNLRLRMKSPEPENQDQKTVRKPINSKTRKSTERINYTTSYGR